MRFVSKQPAPLAVSIILAALAVALSTPVSAQNAPAHRMDGMANMPGMGGMDMPGGATPAKPPPETPSEGSKAVRGDWAASPAPQSTPNMPGMAPMDKGMPGMKGGEASMKDMPGMPLDSKASMQMGPMQGGSPPPDARNPDAYAEGVPGMTMRGMDMADDESYGRVLVNELEYARGGGERGQNFNAEAWYGGDYNKLWLKAEGKRRGGRLENFRSEVLWDRAISTFWSSQLGLRNDSGRGPSRQWLALGVQGLAPYWFETEATAYVGRNGSLAARVEVRYELLFTQKLILQPKLEANFYSKNDPERGIGSGLSDMEIGLRLRYEITRQFAPYIGITRDRKFGNTAAYARQMGESVGSTQILAGVRLWF